MRTPSDLFSPPDLNRFGLGERPGCPSALGDSSRRERGATHPSSLTQAYLHFWDHGLRVPADLAALLIEEGIDVEALEARYT